MRVFGSARHSSNSPGANAPAYRRGRFEFFPGGAGGLFVAGRYLTALQALPLGGRRSEGKQLIAHSDSPALTLALARNLVEDNRRLSD